MSFSLTQPYTKFSIGCCMVSEHHIMESEVLRMGMIFRWSSHTLSKDSSPGKYLKATTVAVFADIPSTENTIACRGQLQQIILFSSSSIKLKTLFISVREKLIQCGFNWNLYINIAGTYLFFFTSGRLDSLAVAWMIRAVSLCNWTMDPVSQARSTLRWPACRRVGRVSWARSPGRKPLKNWSTYNIVDKEFKSIYKEIKVFGIVIKKIRLYKIVIRHLKKSQFGSKIQI